MFKKSKNYTYLGIISLVISFLLYGLKIYISIKNDDYLSGSGWATINTNYLEVLIWSVFFALIGVQLLIIGSLKKVD
jgi:hypothetical protein